VLLLAMSTTSCGGGSSTSKVPPAGNPLPSLISFTPFNATAGGAGFSLTLNGSGFASNASVMWNGNALPTTFVSSNQLTAQVTASDIAAAGIAQITVSNPAPGGGASNVFRFGVNPASPAANFLYASNFADNTISGYSVDPNSGVLTALNGSPFTASSSATNPGPMGMDRLGKFLYVVNSPNVACKGCMNFAGFTPNSSGDLTPLAESPLFALAPLSFVGDPTGNILYDAGGQGASQGADIVTMLIDANSGNLTPIADSPGFDEFVAMALNPAGTFIYGASTGVAGPPTGGVWVGSISPTSGAVTLVAKPPRGGLGVSALTVHPSGKFLFAVNDNGGGIPSSTLLSYTINPTTGALTLLNSIPYDAPVLLGDVVVHPNGGFLYVSDGDDNVLGFSIDGNGDLTALAGSPFSAGGSVINTNFLAMDPAGRFLYAANYDAGFTSNISAFTVDSNSGALALVPGSPFPAGAGPDAIVIAP
jgi:6-phosphogluconolactonase (cycloisomerase 2 family)